MNKEQKIEAIAKVCHETNRAYCEVTGDRSQLRWEDAPEWQKSSARNGVKFSLENVVTPEQSHENWRNVKLQEGWTYGPVKDVNRKEHPCMVPYEALPTEQRTKDTLFLGIVRALQDLPVTE